VHILRINVNIRSNLFSYTNTILFRDGRFYKAWAPRMLNYNYYDRGLFRQPRHRYERSPMYNLGMDMNHRPRHRYEQPPMYNFGMDMNRRPRHRYEQPPMYNLGMDMNRRPRRRRHRNRMLIRKINNISILFL
jgi:hypothetical protein